jgi:hypothetical protein
MYLAESALGTPFAGRRGVFPALQRAGLLLGALFLTLAGGAQGRVKSAAAVPVESPPVIDGRLDDEAWRNAPVLADLVQVEPVPGAPMTEKTEVRIVYDETAIYIAVRCHDRNPAGIQARGRERDGSVLTGDHVAFFFDTFHDRRNGYVFAVSPDEGRWDALISNHFNSNTDWDGVWEVRCRGDEHGWTAEIAIPFKTLSYNREGEVWGFNFSRSIARKGESGRWTSPRPETQLHYAGNAGTLTGLMGLPRHLGLEASPYLLARARKQRGRESSLSWDTGFDVRWRVNPGLTATLSYNMDFADTEVDQRQINFTRFPLFFPEKRDFFLEDSGIYRFADLNEELLIPYFSRRIGLSQTGAPVPILGAAKLAGRVGLYEIGMTAAYLDEAHGVGAGPVFAGRVTRQVFGQSTIGFIATAGDPRSDGDNNLLGVDFRYQTSEWLGDETLVANLFYLNTRTDPAGAPDFGGHAYGIGLSWPGDRFNIDVRAAEISAGFDPALGFIRRNDVRHYSSNWRYLVRPENPSWFQWFSFVYANQIYTDLDNILQTRSHSFYPLVVRLAGNDEISLGFTDTLDRTGFPFTLPGGVVVPPGSYDMLTGELKWKLAERRSLSGEAGLRGGDYYGGDWRSAFANLWWIPGSLTAFGLGYDYNHFDLPGGVIDSHLVSLWMVLRFTPRMRWSNLVQYDTISDTIGFNSRFSWEYRPGHELNAVLSQLYWDGVSGLQLLDSEFVSKLGLQIRF